MISAYLEPEQEFFVLLSVGEMQKKHYYQWMHSPHPQEYFRIEVGRKKLFILIRCVKVHTHTHTLGGWQCYSERMETRL